MSASLGRDSARAPWPGGSAAPASKRTRSSGTQRYLQWPRGRATFVDPTESEAEVTVLMRRF